MTLQAGEERGPRHCSEPTPLVLRPSWAWGSHAPSESAPRQGLHLPWPAAEPISPRMYTKMACSWEGSQGVWDTQQVR